MKKSRRRSIDAIMSDAKLVESALRRSAREALLRHKLAGVPIAVWRNGKTIEIPADEIRIPGEQRPVTARGRDRSRSSKSRKTERKATS